MRKCRCGLPEESVKRTALDRSFAKRHPGQVFESPAEIVDEKLLTRGEKLGTLDRWRQSILNELGTREADRRGLGAFSQLLGQIEEAKHRLSTPLQ
jgi:hypothetical protein